jgi:hypothetical protein
MGRSAYLCPQASCLAAAQKKNRLGRALHASVPEPLYATLWQRLATTPPIQDQTEDVQSSQDFRCKINPAIELTPPLG